MTRFALACLASIAALAALLIACAPQPTAVKTDTVAATGNDLKAVSAFRTIDDRSARSAALFTEAARVIQSPRCLNCHPVDRSPTQGDDLHAHVPPMRADDLGHGPPGLPCSTCHLAETQPTKTAPIASIPGHPHWGLAPASMSWQHVSTGDICRQVKDPARNGGRSLAKIHEHMAEDSLVGWAWHPGPGRTPAPGTQKAFGELIAAWIETGAACPL